jgi:hypothetical protein
MKLWAIVLNYRTAAMTETAVAALLAELERVPYSHVDLVDNHSQDGSEERLRQAVAERGWGGRVSVVQTGHNGGFGYGNNAGIRRALASGDPPEYVYLLNSDAFPDPGSLAELVAFADSHPDAGIFGSYIHGTDGEPHETAFRFPSLASELEGALRLGVVTRLLRRFVVALPIPEQPMRVDWLAGASMLIRREVLERVGLFDETFFLYFEETDLCRRARAAGFDTWYVPASRVAHIGSVSTGMKDRARRVPDFWFASRSHYFAKNHGRFYLWLANLLWLAGYASWRVRRRLQRKPDTDPPRLLADFARWNFSPRGRSGARAAS